MRRFVTRPAVMLLTFCLGLLLVLLYGGLVRGWVRRQAGRAAERVAAPYVAEAGRRHMNRRILLDLRDTWEADSSERGDSPAYRDLEASNEERGEVERRIFPKLFPEGFLTYYGECDRESRERPAASEDDLAWARGRGQFVPYVPDWHRGSFTVPDAFETLYDVNVNECNARESPAPPSGMLAVFDRWDGLHATAGSLPGELVAAVRDVDGDALDEVLLSRGEMQGAKGVFRMRLVSLRGGVLRELHDFGVCYVYSFAQPFDGDRVVTIPVIYYTPRGDGRTPLFEVDFYRADCPKSAGCGFLPRPSEWLYLKSGRLNEGEY